MFLQILNNFRAIFHSNFRLKYLNFLALTLISTIPVIMLGYWVQETALQKELTAVEDKHLIIAKNLSRTFERYAQDTKAVFRHVGLLIANGQDLHQSQMLLDTMGITGICRVNKNLANEFNTAEDCSFSVNSKQLSMLMALGEKSKGDVQISNLDRLDDRPIFFLVQAIGPNQFMLGTLETTYLIKNQKSIAFGVRGHSMVVDATGRVIAHPKREWEKISKDASKLSVVQKMIRGETGVSTFFSPPMQADMIAGHTSVPGVGWGVMVPQPLSELHDQAGDARWIAFFIAMIGIIVASLFGWIAAKALSGPIESISRTATEIANGDSTARVPDLPKYTAREVIDLASSFNQMVSQLGDSHASLLRSRERLNVTLASIGDGVITTDKSNNIDYMNPAAQILTGWSMTEAVGFALFEILTLEDFDTGETIDLPQHDDQIDIDQPTFEGLLIRRDGSKIDVQKTVAKIYDENSDVTGLAIVVRDVTVNRKLEKRLSYEAAHDSLTGLVNRRAFEHRVTAAIQQSQENLITHCLCYLDLDQFKVVNDTCGHAGGDELLRTVSRVIQQIMREDDVLARLGGDEFGILLPDCSMPSALAIAETIRKQVEEFRFTYDHHNFPMGVSIGVVEITDSDNNLGDIFKAADSACYMAKEKGRNFVHAYRHTDEYIAERASQLEWVSRLHTALEEDLFTLHIQPIIPLNTRDFTDTHYELLLRLTDDDQSLIYPDTFLPAAARYNLLPAIDRWVFSNAISWLAKNRQLLEGGRISINLTGATLSEDSFLEFIEAQFETNGMCADAMIIEITESSALNDLACAKRFISSLSEMGCKFALDDFGKGFSSLSSLKHLAVDYLKIDGGFVKDILTDSVDEAMVKTINDIGHSMGKIVVAEFVENEAIQSRLAEMGVDFAQGFEISTPYPLVEFSANKTRDKRGSNK
jgi:diguanylate cyclase (GGDEF)-like protein/PAS domain S-box-containing protein